MVKYPRANNCLPVGGKETSRINPYDYLMELWELLDDEQKERLLEIAETLATPLTLDEDDKPSD